MSDEMEDRLRRALDARAAAVEPRTGPEVVPALAARADAARRRTNRQRTLLSVAAVTVVVAGFALGLALATGDGEELEVAGPTTTAGATTTTTTSGNGTVADHPSFDGPAIWPLPTMSVTFDTPEAAASSFWTGYLGLGLDLCGTPPATVDGDRAEAGLCNVPGRILVRDDGVRGWVVVGAETDAFDLAQPTAGGVVPGDVPVGLSAAGEVGVAVVPLGVPFSAGLQVLGPGDVDATVAYEGEPGSAVVVARSLDRGGVVARVVQVTDRAEPTTTTAAPTTTTTAPPVDDGVQGWPGSAQRRFDSAEAAAQAFVDEVLGFAQPTIKGTTATTVTFSSRPTATSTTTIAVHDTGARGWVVTGATSSQGRIDTPAAGAAATLPLAVSGQSTAFEAQVQLLLLTLDGTVVAESFAMGGSNGEIGPFSGTLDPGPGADLAAGPYLVVVGEGDASGEGDLAWAAVTLVVL